MKCSHEQAVYTKNSEAETLIVSVYVDYPIVISTSVEGVKEFKQQMIKKNLSYLISGYSCTTLVWKWTKKKILHHAKAIILC